MFKSLILSSVLILTAPLHAQVAQNERVTLNSLNSIIIRGEIDIWSMTKAQAQLAILTIKRGLKKYPIYIVLDSPGGSISSGNMFIEFTKVIPNIHTITIFSASMAAAIVESLPGRRLITDGGTLMFHRAYAGVQGQVEVGELEVRLEAIKNVVRRMENVNAARMQLSLAEYKSKVVNEMWLDSTQAVSLKAADKVVDIVCSQELIQRAETIVEQTLFGAVTFKFSKCPLFRAPFEQSDSRASYKIPGF